MKIKAAISALLTAVMLTACGQTEQPVSDRVDVSSAETAVTTSAYSEDITTSAETTTTTTVTTTIADEDSSAVVSSTPSSTQRTVSSTSKAATGKAATTTKKSSATTRQSSANSGTDNNNNNVSGNSGGAAAQAQAHQSSSGGTTAARQTQAPVTTTTPAPVVTAAPPQTTTTTTTTQYIPEPEPEPEPVHMKEYDEEMVNSVGFTKYWLDITHNPYSKEDLIDIGQNLSNDGSDISKAGAVFAWVRANFKDSDINCIRFSAMNMALCEGIGLECYWTHYSNWYQHTSTIVNVDGIWYDFDTMAPSFLGGRNEQVTKIFDDYGNLYDINVTDESYEMSHFYSSDPNIVWTDDDIKTFYSFDEWNRNVKNGIWDKVNYA